MFAVHDIATQRADSAPAPVSGLVPPKRYRGGRGSFRGLGWFLCGVVVAPACYLVTSAGAAERQRLHRIEHGISEEKREIRHAENELATRATLRQVQLWNDTVLKLEPWNLKNLCEDIACVEQRMQEMAEAQRDAAAAKGEPRGKGKRHTVHEAPRGS